MKAWVLDSIGNINLKEIEKPVISEGQVLVKVGAAGICGSDIPRIYKDGAHNMPLVPGHEFSGTVVEAACLEGQKWMGKRVGIFPLIPCQKCKPCLEQKYEMCRHYNYLGSRCDGGFAEYVAVPIWNLIELPDNVSLEQAAMLEPLAVSVHAMRQFIKNKEDLENKKIVICGLGTIGLMLLMFISEYVDDMNNVYVIGSKSSQKNRALNMGIVESHYVDGKVDDVIVWSKTMFGEDGPDYYFECVGNNKTISQGIDIVRPGGYVQLVGNPASDMEFDKSTYWKILRNQLTVKGTWNSAFKSDDDDWHYVLDRLSNEKVSVDELITQKYDIEHFRDGLELMRDKKEEYIKVLLTF